MTTAGLYNIQELRLSLNWSAVNKNSPPQFNIEWAGRISKPISIHKITTISGKIVCYHGYNVYCYFSQ